MIGSVNTDLLYGYFFIHSMGIALVGSALLVFIYMWRSGRLDMDEGPKFQMMLDENNSNEEDHGRTKR